MGYESILIKSGGLYCPFCNDCISILFRLDNENSAIPKETAEKLKKDDKGIL